MYPFYGYELVSYKKIKKKLYLSQYRKSLNDIIPTYFGKFYNKRQIH